MTEQLDCAVTCIESMAAALLILSSTVAVDSLLSGEAPIGPIALRDELRDADQLFLLNPETSCIEVGLILAGFDPLPGAPSGVCLPRVLASGALVDPLAIDPVVAARIGLWAFVQHFEPVGFENIDQLLSPEADQICNEARRRICGDPGQKAAIRWLLSPNGRRRLALAEEVRPYLADHELIGEPPIGLPEAWAPLVPAASEIATLHLLRSLWS
jgi:hypothetical protein